MNILYLVKANTETNISFNKAKWNVLIQYGIERQKLLFHFSH